MKTEKFEPINLGTDQNAYNNRLSHIEWNTVRKINTSIESIEELGFKLDNKALQDFFVSGDITLAGQLQEHFKDIPSKFERQRLIDEYREELESIYRYASNHNSFNADILLLRFAKGRSEISPEAKEKLKMQYSRTLDTKRAKELHDLHDEIFQKTAKLLELLRQVTPLAKYHDLFEMDQSWNLKKPDFDYNRL
ncbi:hypothetical protein MHJ94_10720 [Chryseobacterium taklimakanense]|uniref:hypothetical protein n=1 Tax=Chryseobacterium taklimakanense TaxID=536441 RepID=UPI001EF4B07A|nr:hypothetical protein [Chryseobacterium taklimakanense]MCG7281763.1 hypothetical protein [Chryseobacterium taklimakanense]